MLSLIAINTANAEDSTANVEEYSANVEEYSKFCEEQAQMAGIEDESDFKQYVKDCLESYIGPVDE